MTQNRENFNEDESGTACFTKNNFGIRNDRYRIISGIDWVIEPSTERLN